LVSIAKKGIFDLEVSFTSASLEFVFYSNGDAFTLEELFSIFALKFVVTEEGGLNKLLPLLVVVYYPNKGTEGTFCFVAWT